MSPAGPEGLKIMSGGPCSNGCFTEARDKAEAKMKDLGDSAQPRDLSTIEPGAEDEETLYMAEDDFEAISSDAHLLPSLSTDDARVLIPCGVRTRYAPEHFGSERRRMRKSTRGKCCASGLPRKTRRATQSVNSVRLLGEIGAMSNGSTQTRALELLKLAMEQRDLANDALEAAARIGSEGAVQLLADALTRDDLAAKTITELRQLKTSPAIRLLAQTVDALGPFSLDGGDGPEPHCERSRSRQGARSEASAGCIARQARRRFVPPCIGKRNRDAILVAKSGRIRRSRLADSPEFA